MGAIQIVASMVETAIVEKFGRKPLLLFSDFFVCVSMVAVGIFFKIYESCPDCHYKLLDPTAINGSLIEPSMIASESTVSDVGWLPLVGLMVFVFALMIG